MKKKRTAQSAFVNLRTAISFALVCAAAVSVHADIITVTNTNDSGPGSLRQALADANGGDTIYFAVTGTIGLTSGELRVMTNFNVLTISGPGAENLAVNGNAKSRVFHVGPGGSVTISGLTITNGHASGTFPNDSGGGIYNDHSTLTLKNCVMVGNAADHWGGGIYNDGDGSIASLEINYSSVSSNSGDGAIYNDAAHVGQARVVINNSSLSGNLGLAIHSSAISMFGGIARVDVVNSTISGNAGGINNDYDSELGVSNSTVSDNSGSAIYNVWSIWISNSTFSNNSGTGIFMSNPAGRSMMFIGNTVLKASSSGQNINHCETCKIKSYGYNLSSDDAGGYLNGPGDQINTEPMLGPLQDNGGPTLTHALLPGSPAIDAGDPDFTPPPLYDQRGRGFDRVRGSGIDVGSFEVQATPTPTPTPTATPTPTPTPIPIACSLFENFDNVTPPALPPGWIAGNVIDPEGIFWQTSNSGFPMPPADSPPNAAWVNDPAMISDKHLDSPPVTIDSLENAILNFRNNYALENTFDGGVLEISIDGGAFQDILTAGGSFLQGGYNGTISTCCGNPLAGRQAWTGSSNGPFIQTSVDMSVGRGHTIVLRWRMASDSSASGLGWRIDTVQMICETPTPTATPTATHTPTPTATATATPTTTPSVTPTATPQPSPSPTVIDTPTPTPRPTRPALTPRPRPSPPPRP